jgi:hypothetical protein
MMNTYDIEIDNEFHLNRFQNFPPHPSYISGFIDGDGCIFIRKIKDGYQSGIQITQCRSNILQVLKYHFGGTITTSSTRNCNFENILTDVDVIHRYNRRNEYNLIIRSNEYDKIMKYIDNTLVIKWKQMNCLKDMFKISNCRKNASKQYIYETYQKVCYNNYMLENINISYIAGLCDAEGCFYIDKSHSNFRISISQKSHPIVLQAIVQFIGYGKVKDNCFEVYGMADQLKFISIIKPYLIVKYNQCVYFEEYIQSTDKKRKEELKKLCNFEKHAIENFHELNRTNTGNDLYKEYVEIKKKREKVFQDIRKIKQYKEKSLNMMGSKNHNYGKPKSDETKAKLSKSIRLAKSGLTDENIIEIRNMLESRTIVDVCKDTGFSRYIISGIKNRSIVCDGEEKRMKKLTHKETSKNKRKIRVVEMMMVIDLTLLKNEKPTAILEKIKNKRKIENIENTVTIDIIKNIRRSINKGKLPFHEDDVDTETYELYKTRISIK